MPLLAALLFLTIGAGSAAAQAATNTWSTAPVAQVVAAASTTTSGQTGVSTATTSAAPGQGLQAGSTAVVPPLLGQIPLNPGWKTDQMDVRIMPEYDQKAVLVIVGFSLPATVPLPATFKFPIPAGATIAGIGEVDPNGNFKYNYANSYPPVQSGTQWDIATIQAKDFRQLQIDYYYNPGLPAGAGQRSFPLLVQLPMDAATLLLHVQQPTRATNFQVQPALQGSGKASDGFTYAVATYSDVKAGSTLGHTVSYYKPDGGLSTDGGQNGATPINTNTVLLAAILFVVVCIGGIVVYRLFFSSRRAERKKVRPKSQRGSAVAPPVAAGKRPRPAAKNAKAPNVVKTKAASPQAAQWKTASPDTTATTTPAAETVVAAAPADPVGAPGNAVAEYCIACGEELTTKSRFCPNCGEARS